MLNKEELQKIVGRNLRKYRASAGLTQKQLSQQAGISVACYANLERGNRMMDAAVLCALSDTLHVSLDALLREDTPSVHIQNICHLLSCQPEPFVIEIEHFIRIALKHFAAGDRVEITG